MTEAKPSGLYAALARLQKELPRVGKDQTGKVQGENDQGKRYSYEYKYADLADVTAAILPLLGKHGLAFTSRPTLSDGRFVLAYKLTHESGEDERGEYLLPDPQRVKAQTVGSAITYARRYSLCAVTGLAPDSDDDDAKAAHDATEEDWRSQPAVRPQEEAGPSEPSADVDDGDWGVWHDVIKDITTPEEADQADSDLREVFKTGAMGPTKAGNIRAAIKKRKAEVAGPPSPNGKRREEVPA